MPTLPTRDKAVTISVKLGFKLSDKKFIVFTVSKLNKVMGVYEVEYEGEGKPICECGMFTYGRKCDHSELIKADIENWTTGKDGFIESDTIIDWKRRGPKMSVAIFDTVNNKFAIVDSAMGNVSAFEIVDSLLVTGKIKKPGTLNPHRIYKELTFARDTKLELNNKRVIEAGETVKLPEDLEDIGAAEEYATDVDWKKATPLEEVVDGYDEFGRKLEASLKESALDKLKSRLEKGRKELPLWETVKRPPPNEFYVSKEVWWEVCYSIHKCVNLLLTGPSGCGKSELVWIAAKLMGIHLEPFNMGAMSEAQTALIGKMGFSKEVGTFFTPSRFVRTVRGDKKAAVVLLDELTRKCIDAQNILLPLLDNQEYLALDEEKEGIVIKRAEGVAFAATANIGMQYTGTDALDVALKNRFGTIIDMEFPPADNEIEILVNRCPGLEKKWATKLVEAANKQRQMAKMDGDFTEEISTRMLLEAGRKVGAGFPFKVATKYSIESHFSAEGGDASERTRIQQIFLKGGD